MRPIESRLTKLEGRAGMSNAPFRCIALDGTKEEVEAQLAEMPDTDNVIVRICRPYVGETVNEMRVSNGLPPLNIEGWDVPCCERDPSGNPPPSGAWMAGET